MERDAECGALMKVDTVWSLDCDVVLTDEERQQISTLILLGVNFGDIHRE